VRYGSPRWRSLRALAAVTCCRSPPSLAQEVSASNHHHRARWSPHRTGAAARLSTPRRGRKCGDIPLNAEGNRCACPGRGETCHRSLALAGGLRLAMGLDEGVDHVTVLVNGPSQIANRAVNPDEHLVGGCPSSRGFSGGGPRPESCRGVGTWVICQEHQRFGRPISHLDEFPGLTATA
jgi:hypothetical protein